MGPTVSSLQGSTFVVSDRAGDVDASPSDPQGLFYHDTRFLSKWKLTVDGDGLSALSTDDIHYSFAQFFLVRGTGTVYTDSSVSVLRQRFVGDGFHEDVTVMNHGREPIELEVRLEAAADFADLFEVKDALPKKGTHSQRVEGNKIVLAYQRERYVRETWISATSRDAELDEHGLTFRVRIEPHENWSTCLEVVPALSGDPEPLDPPRYRHAHVEARPEAAASLEEWLAGAPTLESDWRPLEEVYARSLVDLAALRFYPAILRGGQAVPAAGLPWFMALFGRDSLITSYQALPYVPDLAQATLTSLALFQSSTDDAFRDAEPGKILHELRFGELTAFEERPHSPYFGSADSTPLFLIVLDEYERWTGDADLVRRFEQEARAALEWIDRYGDLDGDGYVEYQRRNTKTGLDNQCWKDSHTSIVDRHGELAVAPRAVCEIQGYVYDAKMRCARLAREVWGDEELSFRLEREAGELRERFNRDFWVEELECFALALDGEKRQMDSVTSNIGHLLWSGIVDDDKAAAVAARLSGEGLFSGWGVRTMSADEVTYNPLGYHLGTVWPHDNSLIAAGLARYGYRDEAGQIAAALLEAATYFDGRLPEAFAGYPREETRFPVEYPTACSPQAWASGTPLLLVRTLLGLEPDGDTLQSDPVLPSLIGKLSLSGIPGRWGRTDAGGTRAAAASSPDVAELDEFFDTLPAVVDLERAKDLNGTIRFDVEGCEPWHVSLFGGRVVVTRRRARADTVVEAADANLLLRLLRGEQNPRTAMLQGLTRITGDRALPYELTRLLRRD
ncbi:MAG: SCP2 sterol-binding domain-containing protein [Actinobacteria bacterium]|nr:SCP2 sterol-binding domain-containing protein [Actinomycetota bacterium]